MCVSLFIIKTGCLSFISSKYISWAIFLLSSISGYLIGASIIKELYTDNKIDNKNATSLLPAFINCGPAFSIGMVGCGIFNNFSIGVRIYVSLFLSNLILFLLLKCYKIEINHISQSKKCFESFDTSVKESSKAMINICGYVIFFAAFCAIISVLVGEKIANYLRILLEISGGVFYSKNIYLSCFILAFGGLSIFLQIFSIVCNIQINKLKIIIIRIISAIISVIILYAINSVFPLTASVISNLTNEPILNITNNIPAIFSIILCAIVFCISITQKQNVD